MIPSAQQITANQIDRAVANYRALLEQIASEFSAEAVEAVLEQSQLANDMLDLLRRRVTTMRPVIIRRVKVNRNRTPQEVISATKREKYLNKRAVKTIPKGEGEEVDVYFFEVTDLYSLDVEKEYERRGLKPDPYAQAAVNEADPAFADKYPNSSQWRNAEGAVCYLAFAQNHVVRRVTCRQRYSSLLNRHWIAGVPARPT